MLIGFALTALKNYNILFNETDLILIFSLHSFTDKEINIQS